LPELLGSYKQNVTVEGENFMIAQQTSRGLLKILSSASSLEQTVQTDEAQISAAAVSAVPATDGSDTDYLLHSLASATARCTASSVEDFLSPEVQCDAYRQRAAWLARDVKIKLEETCRSGMAYLDAWNAICPDIIRLSEAHCFYVLVRNFNLKIQEIKETAPTPLAQALQNCCHLFSLWWMHETLGDFLEGGHLDATQAAFLRQAVRDLLPTIRADAVPLVDAWGHSDHALNSALGRYDGEVYKALLASAQPESNPMNSDDVTPAFEESLKPMRRSML
jgi:acyl-CoA oxidase